MKKILIANRGEIAIRIAQATAELDLESVAAYAGDDGGSLHARRADEAIPLKGSGPAAYLEIEGIVGTAVGAGCDAIHPGYGFLSESPDFARAVEAAGLVFIGPTPETLERLGDKIAARALALELNIPVNPALDTGVDAANLAVFMESLGGEPMVLKAVAGGGGRGMRIVNVAGEIEDALGSAREEARAAFGSPAVYAERLVQNARHIEVQIIGDGAAVTHAWERDCSLQRRHQKIVEIAPAPNLDPEVRSAILEAATRLAKATHYRGLGTFEFLLAPNNELVFIEANPRLQVEHTVTEAVTGLDLVAIQIEIAGGASLEQLGLAGRSCPAPVGSAVQARVNLERMDEAGDAWPTGGTLTVYEPPGGRGVRVDGHGFTGLETSPRYDSLLAKVICHSPRGIGGAIARTARALRDFRVDGVQTNLAYLRAVLDMPEVLTGQTHTRMLGERASALFDAARAFVQIPEAVSAPEASKDPLGILDFGRTSTSDVGHLEGAGEVLAAPMQGTILDIPVAPGDRVAKGAVLFVMEAMKMHHSLRASGPATVTRIGVGVGQTVLEGDFLASLEPTGEQVEEVEAVEAREQIDPDYMRPDLAELYERRALIQDAARPDAVAKRRKLGKRTARENVAQLCDADSFVEYGDLAFAAQRSRRSVDDLMRRTPADGLITGFGAVNGDLFGPQAARTAVLAYDYTVLAGTQGLMNHTKKDRILTVIERQRTPVVMFCEGGGGRPGDVDASDTSIAGLYCTTFYQNARLSGLVPMVGIGSGRLFAGNAALLGCCDVVIATRDATIGMGGPAMIEGGGLGSFRPEDVGPSDVQSPNGVIDILVEDEVEAIEVAKRYLAFFQGPLEDWQAPDPRALRHVVPEDRLEVYDVHAAIEGIADEGSVLELRSAFAPGLVTALARIGGRSVGILANNPVHLAGAIDTPGADKASRFLKLCDAFDIPILSLIDTPGMLVGPEAEKTALVRHCCRVFLAGANVTVPFLSVILRKAYGLGAQAMAGGSFRTPLFIIGWPTAEIGGMGLEGAVKLGYRKELEAVEDVDQRKELFDRMVAEAYERGKALSGASILEFDTVIDPAETRQWIIAALDAAPPPAQREGKKRAFVDSW